MRYPENEASSPEKAYMYKRTSIFLGKDVWGMVVLGKSSSEDFRFVFLEVMSGEFPRKVVPGEAFFLECTCRDSTFKFILIVVDPSGNRKTGFLQNSIVKGFSTKEELLLFSESLGKGSPEEIPFVPYGGDLNLEGIISEF